MKSPLALLAIALLGLGATACGGTGKGAHAASQSTATAVTSGGAPAMAVPSAISSQRYLNDGDAEKVNDGDMDNRNGNHEDHDADSSEEYEETYDNNRYHDSDDSSILAYGHAAGAAKKRAIAAAVKRYYMAAAAGDGATACSMLVSSIARAAPEDYGQAPGPAYLRGAKTCAAVMSLLFKHDHSQLTGMIAVTGVRVEGNQARALLGSTTMPAGYISVERERGAWKIDALLGGALP
jgi:hypothetical protein